MEKIIRVEKYEQKQIEVEKNVFDTIILPRERISTFSPTDFEDFICEWASFKGVYNSIHRIGQAGDMGRDVIAYLEDGDTHYFQCKRYKDKLTPSNFWVEFGKLVYYTYIKEISIPSKYYIIAANNLNSKLLSLIKEHSEINKGLVSNWNKNCKNKIKSNSSVDLTNEFRVYIENFDFSIIDTINIDTIIREYSETPLFYFRFGGSKIPKRKEVMLPPMKIDILKEKEYISQLLEVYNEWKNSSYNLSNLKSDSDVYEDFTENRSYYYDAESLRRDLRDVYLGDNEFNMIKGELYSGLNSYMKGHFSNSYDRLNSILHEATKVDLTACTSHSILNFVYNNDKKGICHHLVNDKKMRWKK